MTRPGTVISTIISKRLTVRPFTRVSSCGEKAERASTGWTRLSSITVMRGPRQHTSPVLTGL